jgi:hypothetical protein
MSEDSNLTYATWTVNANDLPAAAVKYLLQNGFSQSMTDAAAFTKAQKEGKSEAEVAAMATEARQKRFDAILAGSVGTRVGGPRLSPVDRAKNDIVDERLAAICKARNVAMPKGDVLKSAKAKIMAKFASEITREAEARVAKTAAEVAAMGDIFGEDEPAAQAAE